MRIAFAAIVACACGIAAAEPHIGFEARVDEEWNCVRIEKFYAASQARGTGLVPGAPLVAINKVPVKHPNTIHRYCKRKKVGDVVTLTISRSSQLVDIKVVLVDGDRARKSGFLVW